MNTDQNEINRNDFMTLINNASIECEVDKIREKAGLTKWNSISFFEKNYSKHLTLYKQTKKSGYDIIVLYKKTASVGIIDFCALEGKRLEKKYEYQVEDWLVYQCDSLKRKILSIFFGKDNIYDKRTQNDIKPSLNKKWETFEKLL